MNNKPKKATQEKKPKRGFAVLDRDEALKAAAGAVGLLLKLSHFAISAAAWRCSLDYALELVETELNDILLFSSASRLPEHLFSDADTEPVPADLGDARKVAAGAVRVLRRILTDARADLSVHEIQCNRLDYALDMVEKKLNDLLPPPGQKPTANLLDSLFTEEDGSAAGLDSNGNGQVGPVIQAAATESRPDGAGAEASKKWNPPGRS